MNLRIKKDEDFRYETSLRFLNLKPGFKIQSVRAADPLATLEAPTDDGELAALPCDAPTAPSAQGRSQAPSGKAASAGRSQPSQNAGLFGSRDSVNIFE